MIMDMITGLEDEAADEASQKAWCDTQMSETTAERDEAQMQIEDLNALLTEKNALVSQLTQEIADLQKALNEETEIRNTEKATNEQTIADAQAGEQAVSQALTFLKDFYSGAKESLLQQAPAAEG